MGRPPASPRVDPAPLVPMTRAGKCGRCGGLLSYDADLGGDKCSSCGRLAGPAPPTPEEIRQEVLTELTSMAAEIIPPEQFWATYVPVDDLVDVMGIQNRKGLREWLKKHGYLSERRRNPKSGKWADFLEIPVAKAAIQHRVGIQRP